MVIPLASHRSSGLAGDAHKLWHFLAKEAGTIAKKHLVGTREIVPGPKTCGYTGLTPDNGMTLSSLKWANANAILASMLINMDFVLLLFGCIMAGLLAAI
jgi:hypothetical protein